MKILIFILLTLAMLVPLAVSAQLDFGELESGIRVDGKTKISEITDGGGGLVGFIGTIINILLGVIIAVGVVATLVGAYTYMTAGGNAGQVDKAKTIIGAALFGIVLALLAQVLLNFISPQFAADVKEPSFVVPKTN